MASEGNGIVRSLLVNRRHAVLLAIVLLAGLVSAASPASAHVPIFLGDGETSPDLAMPLGDPASSGLIYGTLAGYGAQYVSFSIAAGQPFHAMVLRPIGGAGINPAIAIVGPGLGDASDAPFAVPDGDGVQYVAAPDSSVPIYLPDLGLRFLAGASFDGALPGGDYFLVIYSADGSAGDYTVGTGYGP
jgi:hypothetical protein